MLEVTIYLVIAVSAGLTALLLLPIVVAVKVRRADHPGSITFRFDGALFGGLIGFRLHQSGDTRRLYPLWHRWTIGGGRVLGKRTGGVDTSKTMPEEQASDVAVDVEIDPQGEPVPDEPGPGASLTRLITLAEHLRETSRLVALPGLQLLRSLRHVASIRRLTLRGRLGLADPATTGSTCALLLGVRGFNTQRVSIDIAPDFVTPRTEGYVHLVLHLYVGYALACIIRFGVRVGLDWLVLRMRQMDISGFIRQLNRKIGH